MNELGGVFIVERWVQECAAPRGVLNFELGTDVRPEVSTTTL